jgi:predicted PhzF superfamily epimerase YddE/YHI9
LVVEADGARFILDFPARLSEPATPPAALAAALGATPREVHRARDWICVMESAEQVAAMAPDHAALAALPGPERVIVTAAGGDGVDITSRFFAVKLGVPEDPVTGTAHVQLVPFWAARLRRNSLICRQASARGGTLWCEWRGDRVRMAGDAVLYAKGEIHLPP